MKNLINANRFNITFTLYLLLYAVCSNFSRLSLWVFVVLFCSSLGVCNQELEKLESLGNRISRGTSKTRASRITRTTRASRITSPHQTKKKNKVGVAQNPPLKN